MNDPSHFDEELIAQALRMNWDHARHVETQRIQVLAVYVVMALGLGYAVIYAGPSIIKIAVSVLGLFITLFCWGMTRKLNAAFVIQIWQADRCAQHLSVRTSSPRNGRVGIGNFLGFPRKAPGRLSVMNQITVRLMFHCLYYAFTLNWLFFLVHSVFRLMAGESVL